MIRNEFPESRESPEDLFRRLHRNNADILDKMCAVYSQGDPENTLRTYVEYINKQLLHTYGIGTAGYEGEFYMTIYEDKKLWVKFYETGFMELSIV